MYVDVVDVHLIEPYKHQSVVVWLVLVRQEQFVSQKIRVYTLWIQLGPFQLP